MDISLNLRTETVQVAEPASPPCIESSATIREAVAVMRADRRGSVLVCRDGTLAGIFTERDALRLMAAPTDWEAPIESVMTANPVTLRSTDTVSTAIQKMSAGRYRHLPIVDPHGKPVGLLKAASIMHYLVEHFPKAVYNQPPAAHVAMQQREGA